MKVVLGVPLFSSPHFQHCVSLNSCSLLAFSALLCSYQPPFCSLVSSANLLHLSFSTSSLHLHFNPLHLFQDGLENGPELAPAAEGGGGYVAAFVPSRKSQKHLHPVWFHSNLLIYYVCLFACPVVLIAWWPIKCKSSHDLWFLFILHHPFRIIPCKSASYHYIHNQK